MPTVALTLSPEESAAFKTVEAVLLRMANDFHAANSQHYLEADIALKKSYTSRPLFQPCIEYSLRIEHDWLSDSKGESIEKAAQLFNGLTPLDRARRKVERAKFDLNQAQAEVRAEARRRR